MFNEFYKKQNPFSGFAGYGGGASGLASKTSGEGWEILMASPCKNQTSSANTALSPWGAPGMTSGEFRTATASNTGANARDEIGDGAGLYNAFFVKTGITQIAFASHHDGSGNTKMTPGTGGNFARWIIFDLVAETSKTMYTTIKDLDTYNLTNSSWHNSADSLFGTDSVDNFTAGNAKSGTVSSSSGHYKTEGNLNPDKFCMWGVNRNGDDDVQVFCAYAGNLTTSSGKGDGWRGDNPKESFFSYWGMDWNTSSVNQTISKIRQTSPGWNNVSATRTSLGGSDTEIVYMLAA